MFAVGATAGGLLRRQTIAKRVTLGTLLLTAIGCVLAAWVQIVSDPSDGGTIRHFHADRVLPHFLWNVFGFISIGLFYVGPLALGVVTGTSYIFRREKYGWPQFDFIGLSRERLLSLSP